MDKKLIIIINFILSSLLYSRGDCLQYAKFDNLGRSIRPTKETYVTSPSGHLYIH